jgi:hypothetical protein
VSGEPSIVLLSPFDRPLLEAVRTILTTPGLPPVVLIGGLAVTTRVGAAGVAHRATVDIDFVTVYLETPPEAVELIAAAHQSRTHPLVVNGVAVDLIPTHPLAPGDLDGLGDGDRLFLAGHRWAFETAVDERLAAAGVEPVLVKMATPAGLLAAKAHAVGYPSPTRRATKHASDMLDFVRIVDLYGPAGTLADKLRSGPAELDRIIADVSVREITTNPVGAVNQMNAASPTPLDVDDVVDLIEAFVAELRR